MNQNIWGSTLWFSLHTISMNYPSNPTFTDKKDYQNFFVSLQHVIPCKVCRKNYQRHLKELPIDNHLESRQKIVYWLIDLHNLVNAELGKKILSYENVIEKYERIYDKKIFEENFIEEKKMLIFDNSNYIYLFLVILIILLSIGIYYYYKMKK
jgi:hypothetical protein